MDAMTLLRTFAAATTIIAALVAANWNARVMIAGFALFIVVLAGLDGGCLAGKQGITRHPECHPACNQCAWNLALAAPRRKVNGPGRANRIVRRASGMLC